MPYIRRLTLMSSHSQLSHSQLSRSQMSHSPDRLRDISLLCSERPLAPAVRQGEKENQYQFLFITLSTPSPPAGNLGQGSGRWRSRRERTEGRMSEHITTLIYRILSKKKKKTAQGQTGHGAKRRSEKYQKCQSFTTRRVQNIKPSEEQQSKENRKH
ncbi:Uncharacterized protein DAT39_022490 [Clarias magur]|uniref:Uncharacterized protein n=1 Tax=Clarias magur TaxID=1594786 RepID=A0A8J4TZN4_CLAMG|nr:Uncharacterized protein DAT39_022490 [Clarias magur]